LLLEKLYEGVIKVAETYEWDIPMLKMAYQSVIESNYIMNIYGNKRLLHQEKIQQKFFVSTKLINMLLR
jgi:hypothetical protein